MISHYGNLGESCHPAWLSECRSIEGEGLDSPHDDAPVKIISRDAVSGSAPMESET